MKQETEIPIIPEETGYYGEDAGLEYHIRKTVQKLPREVGLFAIDRYVFLSIGKAALGMTLPGRIASHYRDNITENMWIILLHENIPDEEVAAAIAHEIAHAWLNHDRIGDFPEDGETRAANFTRGWGFSGKGTDPSYCE